MRDDDEQAWGLSPVNRIPVAPSVGAYKLGMTGDWGRPWGPSVLRCRGRPVAGGQRPPTPAFAPRQEVAMSDEISKAVQRHLELRAAAAGMRADARREQRREERRAQRERDKQARAERGDARTTPGGCLKVMAITTACIATILILLIVLVMVAPREEVPKAAPEQPTKQAAPAKVAAAAPPKEPAEAPSSVAAPSAASSSSEDVTLVLDRVQLPSPYTPHAVAVVTVKNASVSTILVQINCRFVADDGAILDSPSRNIQLAAAASRTEEIPGKTGEHVFRTTCTSTSESQSIP